MIHRTLPLLAGLFALGSLAQAQGDFLFVIDTDATSFTWSGTTSVGDIEPDPADFSLSGTTELALESGGAPVGMGQYTGAGDALVVPNIGGEIPNPIPILPPLAEFDVEDVHLVLHSEAFTVDAAGDYVLTDAFVEILSGTMTFDPLIGDTVVTDLAGVITSPTDATGTLTENSGTLTATFSIDLVIDLMDPDSGITATVTLSGTLVADFDCPAATPYCQSAANSVGPGAQISAGGSTSIAANSFTLNCSGLPNGQFGIFYFGPNQVEVPFGDGFRCVSGSVTRRMPVNSGVSGSVAQLLDFPNLPPSGQIAAGDTDNFQFWYRDPAGLGSGFNLSGGLSVFFCP